MLNAMDQESMQKHTRTHGAFHSRQASSELLDVKLSKNTTPTPPPPHVPHVVKLKTAGLITYNAHLVGWIVEASLLKPPTYLKFQLENSIYSPKTLYSTRTRHGGRNLSPESRSPLMNVAGQTT